MQRWIAEELQTVNLGDKRLNRRFHLVLDALAAKPAFKFNAACRGHAEVAGAYRFVNSPRVDLASILAPHLDASRQRLRAHPVVLLVQDTSELDLTRPKERITGGGPLNDAQRWGFFLHPLMAFTPTALPLGLVHVNLWARDPEAFARPAAVKAAERKRNPIEEKESVRWLEGYRQACQVAASCPDSQIVCISDSEGDIFECYRDAEPVPGQPKAQWITRACQNRALVADEEETRLAPLFDEVAQAAVLTTLTLEVRERPAQSGDGRKRKQARSARTATVRVQAARLTLRGPQRPGQGKLADVTVNVVLLRAENPPPGEEAIEWLLLSSLPISTVDEVLQVVAYYCCRWQIEIYFKVLKSGCEIEASQLATREAFLPYVGLCLIVAWRVMYLQMLGRECPELPCDHVLEEEEWQSVYAVVTRSEPPATPPPLGEMVKQIASLGGYLGRKGDGPPGPKTLWRGLQRMADLAEGWRARGGTPSPRQQEPPSPRQQEPSSRASRGHPESDSHRGAPPVPL